MRPLLPVAFHSLFYRRTCLGQVMGTHHGPKNDTFALNARNHGSAIAGISDVSFISNTIDPDRLPLSSAKKYAASGLRSASIFSTVLPSVPFLAAAI